jgi:spore coat polysaccharide biosynthesis protein SpsF (cytidylyltransferase family)
MLKVYNVHDYVSIDGAKWRKVGGYGYKITDEEVENTLVLDNVSFEEARKYLSEHLLDGVWNDNTLFRNKPTVVVRYQDAWDCVEYRHFDTMSYKREYKEDKNVSFKWLTEHLTADQFIQYLKERGITTCPMNF